MRIDIWTDGSCQPNPGSGGWAAVLKSNGLRKEISGYLPLATNNIAELMAVIEALRAIKTNPHDITFHTDSEYTKRAIDGVKKPKANFDLLSQIKILIKPHGVRAEWLRGHSGDEENERCDELAREARLNGAVNLQ